MFEIHVAAQGVDISLLLLRLTVALVFGTSGFSHLKSPQQRAESLGLSVPFTVFLGAVEVAGALGLAFGVLTQWAALGLILIMFGAVYMKVVKWKTGFWGEKSSGWHYDVLFIVMNLTILTTGGGHIALLPPG
ncbi:MAG TPA: DoxX family protein [Terracidiphilus sp.]|jgi:putative oxidoreductase|nr:DoxX family protein [Terracidiphilus sp.]